LLHRRGWLSAVLHDLQSLLLVEECRPFGLIRFPFLGRLLLCLYPSGIARTPARLPLRMPARRLRLPILRGDLLDVLNGPLSRLVRLRRIAGLGRVIPLRLARIDVLGERLLHRQLVVRLQGIGGVEQLARLRRLCRIPGLGGLAEVE
jgi:hypothetical protein